MKLLPVRPTVRLDDLHRLDIRVGTILAVHEVENSSKLVQLIVSFGDFSRSIVVGLKRDGSIRAT